MVKAADYINLVVHIGLLFAFIYYAGLAIINQTATDASPAKEPIYGPAATVWCGFSAVIVGIGLLSSWMFYLVFPNNVPLEDRSSSWWLHASFGLTSAIMLIIAGKAMFRNWLHGMALYIIASCAFLAANAFPLFSFRFEGTPKTFHIAAVAISAFLLLLAGASYSAKSLRHMQIQKMHV